MDLHCVVGWGKRDPLRYHSYRSTRHGAGSIEPVYIARHAPRDAPSGRPVPRLRGGPLSRSEPPGADEARLLERGVEAALARLVRWHRETTAGEGKVTNLVPIDDLERALGLDRWIARGGMDLESLDGFLATYLDASTRLPSPRYMAHQVTTSHPGAAIADLVHGVTDNPMAIYEMGPAGGAAERAVVRWMLGKAGWPEGCGVLTHGGSLANLTALLAARAAAAPEAWDEGTPDDLVLLAAPTAHYSVARAASILGLGSRAVRPLPVDARGVVVGGEVADALRGAADEGRRVMAVVADACATATGLHDPLEAMADACRAAGVWLHVDGAHGATALVSEHLRPLLSGVERADSLVWDAHKMMRVSTVCTGVLCRDPVALDRAFRQEASYLQPDAPAGAAPGPDVMMRAVECTKSELGLKAFLVLAHLGEAGVAAYVEGRYDATRRFWDMIRARPGFECPYEPESNILCFRWVGDGSHDGADLDALQRAIRRALMAEGSYHLSSATIGERRYLRMAVMSPHTDETTIAGLLDAIERVARESER